MSCPTNCITCSSPTNCTVCSPTFYILVNTSSTATCVNPCPTGYYADLSARKCVTCDSTMTNCTACTSANACTSCKVGSALKTPTNDGCYGCDSTCMTCIGSTPNQCTDCYYPLFLSSNKCIDLNCNANQYVNSLTGCVDCSSQYSNSLTCNNVQPLTCISNYFLYSKACQNCNSLPGFIIVNGQCMEICGDGYNYNQGCDDGNTLDGDGCSSTCSVEKGWKCNSTSTSVPSTCYLLDTLTLTMLSA